MNVTTDFEESSAALARAVRRPSARFGGVIRELRESRGWSQEHLAGQATLNRSYMGEIERSAAVPSLVTAEKLAHALDVSLSELISRCERVVLA